MLHGVIQALSNDFEIGMPRDLVRLVRKSRKSKVDENSPLYNLQADQK